jgi:hypothetical protein
MDKPKIPIGIVEGFLLYYQKLFPCQQLTILQPVQQFLKSAGGLITKAAR